MRLNTQLRELKNEVSDLKGEIELLKERCNSALTESPLEEHDESKKRLKKRKKKTKTTTETCPEEGKGRHLGMASHVFGRRKTPLWNHSRQEVTKMLERVA